MDKVFENRHSVKCFRKKKINPADLNEILKAAYSAPSAGNLKSRKILVVKKIKIKEDLARAAFGQSFIVGAPVILIFFAAPSDKKCKKYPKRDHPLYLSSIKNRPDYWEKGLRFFSSQDATIAASFAWLQAVSLGLAGCWVGAFSGEEVKKILKIKNKKWFPVAILPIGYSGE